MATKEPVVKASPEKAKPDAKSLETTTSDKKPDVKSVETSTSDKKSVKKITKSRRPKGKKVLLPGTVRYGRSRRAIIRRVLKPHIQKKKKEVTKAPVKLVKINKKSKKGKEVKGKGKKKTVETRQLLVKRPPSYYPTEVKKGRTHEKKKTHAQRLKKSLTPGVVCIVVAGPHKGKRVVFLKQLASGLCLITGPFILNKCPLRRINQIYLIGTSTKVELGETFKVPEHIDDKYFKKVKLNKKKPKKDEGDIFNEKPKKYLPSAIKRGDQKIVDTDVLKAMRNRKDKRSLCAYMSNKFRLSNQQYPHALKF